ncbi:Serine/threonine-protein kinase par-1 [Frankliniella fusca]|uniref:Serine/threonine-protein kinase par-1 n=1 Tax=Frankliniella fusca TaxID=407009 RepID=A0AAE1H161_9NEOP|nr:Serine/threonine-protein kinase par-1 [Frankliniella fusca]
MLPSFGPPCIVGRYRLVGKVLGKGNYARVEEAVHLDLEPSEAHVAIKMIDTHAVRDPYVLRNLEREAEVLRLLRHPNIIAIFEVLKAGRYHCLVTELVGGGELCAYVRAQPRGRLDEATTLQFGAQLISALAYMHGLNVVHRDLKMKNIVLTRRQDQVKIADFGLSRTWSVHKPLLTHCGSPGYAAPEIYLKNSRPYGPKVDLWSLGVVLYYMAVGAMPFPPCQDKARSPEERRKHLLGLISKGATEVHVKHMAHFSPDFRDLVQGLLTASPSRRLSLQQAVDHPWAANRLRARQLLNIQYKLSGQERALILTKLAVMLNTTVQSIEAQCRQKDLGEVAAMYNIMAHKQLSTYHASWTLRPASPRRVVAEVTATATLGQGLSHGLSQGLSQGLGRAYTPSGSRSQQHSAPRRPPGTATAAEEGSGSDSPQVCIDQPDSSTAEGDGGDEDDRERAVSVQSEQEAAPTPPTPAPRSLPAPRQRLALQGVPRPEPRSHEPQGAPATPPQRTTLQGVPRPEPRAHERAPARPEERDAQEGLQEVASVPSTATPSTAVASTVLIPETGSVDTLEVDVGNTSTDAKGAATSLGGQDPEYDLACLLRDSSGQAQLEPMPETRVMFYTQTVLDINDALYTGGGASKSVAKVLVNAGTATPTAGAAAATIPIKSALASQTGLAAKTRKAVSFSGITTTHSADSGADGSAEAAVQDAVQDAARREMSVQADLKPLTAAEDGAEAKVEGGGVALAHGHRSGKVDQGANATQKKQNPENTLGTSSRGGPQEAKDMPKEEKLSCPSLGVKQSFLEKPSSSYQLKNCLTRENIAATEKLLKTVPVSRKISPEPKKHIFETRRWPLKSPREVYRRMKGHPGLSVSYLLCDQENFTSPKTTEEQKSSSFYTPINSASLPAHKEDSGEDENTTLRDTEEEKEKMKIDSVSDVEQNPQQKHQEHSDSTHSAEINTAQNIKRSEKSISSGKGDLSNKEEMEWPKDNVSENTANNNKKKSTGTVAELVRSKIGSLRVKEKYLEIENKEKTQPKFQRKERRTKPPKYQRFISNRYRVDLALVMTLERSRKNLLPSIHGPWRPTTPDTFEKYPETGT